MSQPDFAALRTRAEAALGGVALSPLEPLPGGISSLTFSATASGSGGDAREVVVKVAPPGLAPVRNRDVLRQARVLRALDSVAGVRVPAVLGEDPGDPPLFVMSFEAGESFEPRWDAPAPSGVSGGLVRERALAAARMLAALQAAPPVSLGAGVADEPVLTPREELARWAALYETVGSELRGGAEAELRGALTRSAPELSFPRVLHGDYRLGNLLFDGAELTAIIDWEIWSVGDPRCDVGWLMHFCDPGMERREVDAGLAEALPGPSEVMAAYLDAASAEMKGGIEEGIGWFVALAAYKLGATMAVLAKRNRRRPDPDPSLERAAETTRAMLDRALSQLVGR